ncbi:MAG: outer membrane protein assembly factor BamA [Cytophagales bacterium]|nr:outer membrane protein assembly factor BamA [Cytophagales bacterium]
MKQSWLIKKEKEGLAKLFNLDIYLLKRLFGTILLLLFFNSSMAQFKLGLGNTAKPALKAEDKIALSYANPREYEIAEIKVTGLETIDKNALISLSGLKVGDKIRIPSQTTSNAIKKLWDRGIIGNVTLYISKVEGDKAFLVLELTERPRLTRIFLKGVNKTQETDIKENLDLIKGKIVSDAVLKNAELTVKDYFVDKGFLNTEVNIEQKKDTIITNGVLLNIRVNKKSKVRIDRITFHGNEDISDDKLRSKFKKTNEKLRFDVFKDGFRMIKSTTPQSAWNFLTKSHEVSGDDIKHYLGESVNVNFFKTSKFKKDEYKEDKNKLITYYNSKGYRDARIISDSIYDARANEINIDLKVEEGNKYYFGDITWSGNFVRSDELLSKVLGVKKGDVYDMELIQKKLTFNPNGEDISSLYMDYGYLFFSVNPVEVRINNDSIDVEMRVYEGDQARINKVIITGNDRTNDHVIRREIRTLPGQFFNRSLLIRTQQTLSQLGYFDPEQIGINPIPNPLDGTVDIEYSLVERPSDQVELSGGWGGFYGFVGTVGLVFNNFSLRNITNFKAWKPLPVGDGQRLSLRVQANGRIYQNYSVTFTEPWLGGKKPNSLTIGANRSVIRNTNYYSRQEIGSMVMNTISAGLGKRLKWPDDYFTMSNTFSYTHYVFDNYVSSSNNQIGFSTGIARNLKYNLTIARNSVDQPMFPRSGSEVSLSIDLTPPYSLFRDPSFYDDATEEELYGWVEYHKWMFDAKYYQKLVGNLVFAAKAHFGFISTYSDYAPTGPFDRFQMGGSGLSGASNWIVGYDLIALRGYEDNQVTPPGYGRFLPTEFGLNGGVAYNKFVFELRYPLSLAQSSTIYVLGFAEAGNNFHTLQQFDPFNNYRSVGIGARIFMPAFGLLGIDWGYGFDTLPGQPKPSGGQFHFSIGQQFR